MFSISSKGTQLEKCGLCFCSENFIDFLISELACLKQDEVEQGFLVLSESVLMLSHDHEDVLKKVIFYGMLHGLREKNYQVLTRVLLYIDRVLNRPEITPSDSLSLYSAKACAYFDLFSLTKDLSFLFCLSESYNDIVNLLSQYPSLKNKVGWEHLRLGEGEEEDSQEWLIRVYNTLGQGLLTLYYKEKETEFIVKSSRCFSEILQISPHHASSHAYYAECLQIFGLESGNSSYISQAMEHLSRAIFISFNRDIDSAVYNDYRYKYALSAVRLFYLTYRESHFLQANRILYQTVQSCPTLAEIWILWGELLLRSGWLNSNVKYIEAGLDKLSSAQKRGGDPVILSSLLANGIAMLGLYLDEPNLFKESQKRLLSAMRVFPGNLSLIQAFGSIQLCSALYFSDDTSFSASASCFKSCMEWDTSSINTLQKLFDVYFAWGVRKNSEKLLKKAVQIMKRLCSLRPEVFLFWSDRGLALKCLAEFTADPVYKEIYLEESLLYYRKAWELNRRVEILELWGHSCYLLADLQDSLPYYDQAFELLSGIDEDKQSFKTRILLASILLGKGKLLKDEDIVKTSLEMLQSLVIDHPDHESIFLLLGEAYLFLFWHRNCTESARLAKMYLERSIALGCSEAYYVLGGLYALQRNLDQAWSMVLRAISFGVKITESRWLNDRYLANLRDGHAFYEVMANQRGKLCWVSRTEVKKN